MERMFNTLDKISTPRNLVIGIISAVIVVSVMGTLTQILVYEVYGDANMPDTNFGYTFADIQSSFNILGSEGLNLWLQVHLLDVIFPLTYAFSMVFGILMEIRASLPEKKYLRLLALLPIGGAIADYIENTLIATQVVSYPALSESIIAIASLVTIMKWLLLYAGFITIFSLLFIVAIKRVRK
jgi:hypothetical protein